MTTDLQIEREVLIEAPADVVWRTITEPDQIARWFADKVELELRPGGAGTLFFEDKATTRPFTAPLVVVDVEPPKRFTFRWAYPEGEVPGPGNSVLVEFTLTQEGSDCTRLRVTETGLDTMSWPDEDKARYVAEHRHGWAEKLGWLQGLFAAGE
jgi:uncharacterized protein YndB with AHSA1/START domain